MPAVAEFSVGASGILAGVAFRPTDCGPSPSEFNALTA
jgi:hypothetical protein